MKLGHICLICAFACFLAFCQNVRADDYSFARLSIGHKISHMPWGDSNWMGNEPVQFTLGHYWELYPDLFVGPEVSHISNIRGVPINDRKETFLDWWAVTVEYRF